MLDQLQLFNLPCGQNLLLPNCGEIFVLNTCQRSIALGFSKDSLQNYSKKAQDSKCLPLHGHHAYTFMLETLCGLQSQILGENEIVGQFKTAYSEFVKLSNKNTIIQKVLEKLLMDAKLIRSSYLLGLGHQTYAGIVRKLLLTKASRGHILILGSGQLAENCIKLLYRKFNLSLAARTPQKIQDLKNRHPNIKINVIPYGSNKLYKDYSFIINTIGAEELTLFNQSFFQNWNPASSKLFVDLGSPSVLKTSYGTKEDVYRLDDIFTLGESLNQEKLIKVSKAKEAMNHLVEKRKISFKLPNSKEEMLFA